MTQTTAPPTPSQRELECLQLAVYGYDNSAIASTLHIAEGTVKTHFRHLLQKLEAKNRTQAAAIALQYGWIKALPDR